MSLKRGLMTLSKIKTLNNKVNGTIFLSLICSFQEPLKNLKQMTLLLPKSK